MSDGISISIVNMNVKRNLSECNEKRRGLTVLRGWVVARVNGESLEPLAGRLTEQEAEKFVFEVHEQEALCQQKSKSRKGTSTARSRR